MKLSDLAAYAREKHHIEEQHKWADFPGFSVLPEPRTGKWAALLMRQWDGESGEELQRCDIKCGRQCLAQIRVPWLTLPFRMKGRNWVGVILDRQTDPRVVYRLFDTAVASIGQQGAYAMVLEELRGNTEGLYRDTVLPPREKRIPRKKASRSGTVRGLPEEGRRPAGEEEHRGLLPAGEPAAEKPAGEHRGADPSGTGTRTIDPSVWTESFFRSMDGRAAGGSGRSGGWSDTAVPQIPEKIREMMRLYEYRGESLEEKSRNFYRQGRFMEDYEDDAPWTGEYRRYFTTYHDLHLNQLRGYFTWRTAVRKGEFRPIAASLAYMYVYELLCGIGAASPEDSLRKMREFEKGFLDSGIGDSFMRRNLHRWMLDYAVIHNVPLETGQLYEQLYEIPAVAERDRQMAVLKEAEKHTDEEVFRALCAFGGKKIPQSPVVTGHGEKGIHLFAALWRLLTAVWPASPGDAPRPAGSDTPAVPQDAEVPEQAAADRSQRPDTSQDGSRGKYDAAPEGTCGACNASPQGSRGEKEDSAIFTACFGTRRAHPWRPLTNAIHWEEEKPVEAEYVLNPCRSYRCHEGEWTEERYENPYFAGDRLQGLLHAADKDFRRYLKTGHYLRAKKEEEWAEPYIEAVITADREAERAAAAEAAREAAMAKITIDLSGLEQIRRDASVTRDSLLTEAEMAENPSDPELPAPVRLPAEDSFASDVCAAGTVQSSADRAGELRSGLSPQGAAPAGGIPEKEGKEEQKENREKEAASGRTPEPAVIAGLDLLHTQILCALLRDGSAEVTIRQNRLIPSIVADTINEALFDEIGDNVVECDEDTVAVVEDYREELEELLEVSTAQLSS